MPTWIKTPSAELIDLDKFAHIRAMAGGEIIGTSIAYANDSDDHPLWDRETIFAGTPEEVALAMLEIEKLLKVTPLGKNP